MKILMTTDGSGDAQAGLQTALRLLKPEDRRIDLLCVAPSHRKGAGKREYEQRILAETTAILERAREIIGKEASEVHLVTAIGSAAGNIVRRAEDYDLTVIGPKGVGSGENVGLGPVASRVAEHALAPVLIARELRSESGSRVLVAVDGSSASRSAIDTLVELFDLKTSSITLMHVEETPWIHLGLEDEWASYDEEDKERSEAGVWEKEMTREARAIIEKARDQLRPTGAAIETIIEEGNPAEEIVNAADRGQYDLIVAGASGTRDLRHSMLGSVSAKIAWDAPCSVLIVREPA
jgi:nucleotide-binding universal stress UspA family protein